MPKLREQEYAEFVEEIRDEDAEAYDHDDCLGNDLYEDEE